SNLHGNRVFVRGDCPLFGHSLLAKDRYSRRVDTSGEPIYIEVSLARTAACGCLHGNQPSNRAPVAQLDRAMAYGAIGWGFESLQAYSTFHTPSLCPAKLGQLVRPFRSV